MQTRSFFRWMPTAIILWVFGVLFAFAAGICALQVAHDSSQVAMIGDTQQRLRWFLRGAITDAIVAVCCILGWYSMRRRLPAMFTLGGILVLIAAFIIGQRSLIYLI